MTEKTKARRPRPIVGRPSALEPEPQLPGLRRQTPSNRARRREALEQQGRAAARPLYPEPESDGAYKP